MSTQYNRISSALPAQSAQSRRNPLANAPVNQQTTPTRDREKAKAPSSPPLPRQNTKATPPTPPKIISDKSRSVEYSRVGFLGEGGFARVYEVKDVRGTRLACKVITKTSLKTKKAKTKLYAEIKIHRSLDHPNVVNFQECFEDDQNVYMTLELCPSGSLMDMLRRRRRFTEPEARFFMVQLVGACHYMHTHQVIHRDLKLGNLFLDANMNIKVGDFGLAALIESPGERKKTICGTPNYIAPEVLFDTANGHSFEVDTWSVGVILYTLVVGRPPFQTKDVKTIYKRIRDNDYAFPTDRQVSSDAQELVQDILAREPENRPTLHQIIDHPFFIEGIVPGYIPTSAHDSPPDFKHISRVVSDANLARLRRYALLDEDQVTNISLPAVPQNSTVVSGVNNNNLGSSKVKHSTTSSIAQQEKEFQKAVQPGSPISALLSSARQPLLISSTHGTRESSLLRKLQGAAPSAKSPGRTRGKRLQNIEEEEDPVAQRGLRIKAEDESRKKELESQKARIVAQMVPGTASAANFPADELENLPPVSRKDTKSKAGDIIHQDQGLTSTPLPKLNGFDAAAFTLSAAFEAKSAGKLFRNPKDDISIPDERVFIVSWVDYCNKYGMGYALTDGSVGVHFNDSTTLVLSPDKNHFDYISSRKHGAVYVRKNYNVSEYPEDLKTKVYLLKHFERYIMDRLYGDYEYTFEDTDRGKGMDFVQKYLRMKHVIVFKMSHDVLQFNFYDHSKVILSSHGLLVTHIDKNYKMTRWTLSKIMAQALRPNVADPEQAKFNQKLVDKLKYCKEVLMSIRNASATPAAEDGYLNANLGVDGMAASISSKIPKIALG